MMLDPTDKLSQLAIHEAAHYVASFTLGGTPKLVSIIPNHEMLGRLEHTRVSSSVKNYVVMSLAGGVAESVFVSGCPGIPPSAWGDLLLIREAIAAHLGQVPLNYQATDLFKDSWHHACELVTSQWQQIEGLAHELRKREVMTHDACMNFFRWQNLLAAIKSRTT